MNSINLRPMTRRLLQVGLLSVAAAMSLAKCSCLSPTLRYQLEFTPAERTELAESNQPDTNKAIDGAKPQAGDTIVFGGAKGFVKTTAGVEFYDPHTRKWAAIASLPQAGVGASATELNISPLSGQILLGENVTGKITFPHSKLNIAVTADHAEIFHPASASFTSVGPFLDSRAGYTQTLLPNNKVLIAGGIDSSKVPTNKAELFDPATSKFTATGNMNSPRALHTATLLNDDTVLITGGLTDAGNNTLDTAEIYDPDTGKFTELPALIPISGGLAGHTATLISGCDCAIDGSVLLAGGYTGFTSTPDSANNTAILYDADTQTFVLASGQMTDFRVFHTATALPNGKVLIAGGVTGQALISDGTAFGIFGGVLNTAEVFDPKSEKFTCVNGSTKSGCNGSMVNSRAGHAALLMTSSPLAAQVLLAGGMGGKRATSRGHASARKTAELYNPSSGANGKFSATGSMKSARAGFAAVLLQ